MRAEALPAPDEGISTSAVMLLVGAMLLALALHLATPMNSYYGEPDATALVSDALLWVRGGIRTNAISEYRYYTSPGYIWLITRLLPDSGGDLSSVALTLNRINVAASVVIIIPLFLLCRRLAGLRAALIASVLVSFVPAFFQGGLYGFPTLLAEFFLLWTLWFYDCWLASEKPWGRNAGWLVAACGGLVLTVLLKADVYIGAVALWGLLVLRGRLSWGNAAALAVTGAIPVVVLYGFAQSLLVQSPASVQYAADWNTKFPLDFWGALNAQHLLQILKSMGLLMVPAFVVALIWLAWRRRWGLAAMLAVWAAAPIGFWFARAGDSARHHFPASVPVVFGVALLIAAIPGRTITRLAVLVVLLAVDYGVFPPSPNTLNTSGRLVGSGRLLAGSLAAYHRGAGAYAGLALPKQVFVGGWHRIWYVRTEVLGQGDSLVSYRMNARFGLPAIDLEYLRSGQHLVSTLLATNGKSADAVRAAADAYIRDGFRIFAVEFDSTLTRPVPIASYRLVEYAPRAGH